MKIEKITPQIAALYLGHKCELELLYTDTINDVFAKGDKWDSRIDSNIHLLGDGGVKITPHLRRLESLTEDEAREICEIFYGKQLVKKTGWLHLDFLFQSVEGVPGPVIGSLIGSPSVWLKLLEWGIDLFGLIDSGLAKEIKPKTD